MEYVKFGSIYWNGKPIQYDHVELFSGKTQSLTVGNTVPGCEIQFVRWSKLLVGECNACNNLSWDVLDKNGLIFGCFVTIASCKPLPMMSLSILGLPRTIARSMDHFGVRRQVGIGLDKR